MNIYTKLSKNLSLSEFLKEFVLGRPETYTNRFHTRVRCRKNKTRSLTDTIWACNTHFGKKFTLLEIISGLHVVSREIYAEEDRRIQMSYCPHIRKITLFKGYGWRDDLFNNLVSSDDMESYTRHYVISRPQQELLDELYEIEVKYDSGELDIDVYSEQLDQVAQ